MIRGATLAMLAGASWLALGTLSPAGAQNANPQLLTLSWSGCHGPRGHSPGPIPSIYGPTADEKWG